jgi:hypothetical protein
VADLTHEQRRQLDELAGELARDNPRLARALAGRWHAVRRRRTTRKPRRGRRGRALDWLALILILAAVPLLSVGVIVAQPVLIMLGAVAWISGPALFAAARLRRPPAV